MDKIKLISEIYNELLNCYDFVEIKFTLKEAFKYESIYFKHKKINYRFSYETRTIQKGEKDFDRWANSVETTIYLKKLNPQTFFTKFNKLIKY